MRIILGIALIAAPTIARADDPPPRTFEDALGVSFTGSSSCDCQYYPDEVPKPSPWDTVGALGFVIEKRDIGGTRTDHLGVMLGAGVSRGRYQLGGELHVGFDRTDVEPVASGFAGQASIHLRRDLIERSGSEDDFGAGFNAWLDAGAGAELVWFGGDQVVRPVATLGVGLGGRAFKASKPGRWAGLSLEFRVVAAPSIEWRDLAAERCTSGDCDMRLAKPDFSGLLVIGLPFSS